jgi:hypothetical protein
LTLGGMKAEDVDFIVFGFLVLDVQRKGGVFGFT